MSDSDSDVPIAKKARKTNVIGSSPMKPEIKQEKQEKPKKPRKKRQPESDEEPVSAKVKKEKTSLKRVKSETKSEPRSEADDDGQKAEEEYKWWLDTNKDSSVKWTTLEHNGPYFPPEYVPHGIQMKYDGKPVVLKPASEEVATFYAALIGTDWGDNPVFQQNFFKDFLNVLSNDPGGKVIKEFQRCDFSPITDYLNKLKENKKSMTKEEKKVLKDEKQVIDDQFGWCLLDGRKEKVGNFRIEPPGLFRGRGEHPKTGSLKTRVTPEQVTINIGPNAKIPEPPAGHHWGSVIHDNSVTWLAMWKENVNDTIKYVFLAANSSLKGQSDFKKFEKARELKKYVKKIRSEYTDELKSDVMATRQRATALYFIDRLALRAGNEKGDDEADTVGCCSLRFEHITLEPPNKVIFDFLGKDSIRYYNQVEVEAQVFKNLKIFKKPPKKEGDDLFDRLDTSLLNKHLKTYMDGLTAKVFRTFNASYTFQEELKKTPADASVAEKILAYNRANRQVAILCNHQRAVPKAHGSQITKLGDKILLLKYERYQLKQEMIQLDPKLKKKPEYNHESDIDEEAIQRCEELLEQQRQQKAKVKLEKLNEKRKQDGEEPLEALPEEKGQRAASNSIEKLEKKLATVTERIKTQKTQLIDKDENKTTALGTSKINYIDPRISAAWCHKYGVPLEKIFNRSLRDKFKWAMEVDADWQF